MNVKMAEAVTLAKIAGTDHVDRALGDAALHGRFAHPDLASILNANIRRTTTHAANEATSLTQGLQPLKTRVPRQNIRNPAQSGTVTAQSETQSVETVHTPSYPSQPHRR